MIKLRTQEAEQHYQAKHFRLVGLGMDDDSADMFINELIEAGKSYSNQLVYLASPYSHEDKNIVELRFHIVCKATARLMESNIHVFSPIAHSHPIANHLDNHLSHDFWLKQDFSMLERCSELWILTINGWRESYGIKKEIELAEKLSIPVRTINERLELTNERFRTEATV